MSNTTIAVAIAALALTAPGCKREPAASPAPGPAVVDDLRTFHAAETAYASVNGGYFDTPVCLGAPSTCLKGYGADKPVFLQPELATFGIRGGYVHSFHSGPMAPAEAVASKNLSPSSLVSWCYVAVPTEPGQRSYCIESSGKLCATAPGAPMDRPNDAKCPAGCEELK
jgi:hypothetical protein